MPILTKGVTLALCQFTFKTRRSIVKVIKTILIALTVSGAIFTSSAQAVPLVTYEWTTTSEGFGLHISAPSSATFQVPLSDVLNGVIPQFDITNIQLTYPGLTFDSAVASSIGFDFSASVDPTTGAFIFHDIGQGLAVIAFAGTDINSATTFLSITVDNPNQNLTGVADQFNALSNGSAFAGFSTAGFWTAEFPAAAATPLPATLPLFATGLGALGLLGWRRKKKTTALAV
jgi:hypothetical protein